MEENKENTSKEKDNEKSYLTDMEFDALREVGNVGVGNAVTALSKILNKKISINIPETKFVKIKDFAYEMGGPEKIVMGIYLKMSGDLTGETLFFFSKESALHLVSLMDGDEPDTLKEFNDLAISAFGEMANIFSGAYLSAMSNMLNMKILPGIPYIANDMVQSIADFALARIGKVADEILCIKTKIDIDGHDIDGEFVVMLDKDSMFKLLVFLKKKYGEI